MTADTVGGVWTYALDLCRALAPSGVRVTLATMGDAPRADQLAQAAALPNLTLQASTFKLEWMQDPWEDLRRAGDWLLELESKTRPDLVHLQRLRPGVAPVERSSARCRALLRALVVGSGEG